MEKRIASRFICTESNTLKYEVGKEYELVLDKDFLKGISDEKGVRMYFKKDDLGTEAIADATFKRIEIEEVREEYLPDNAGLILPYRE